MSEYQFTSLSILPLIIAVIAAVLSYLTWRRRTVPGSIQLTWLMLAVSGWALAHGFETASSTASQSIFWTKAAYPGILSIAPLFTLFVLEYSQKRELIHPRKLALLWIVPIITIFLVFTNENHGLIWVSVAYAYILLLIASVFLVRRALQTSEQYRLQAIILIVAIFPPWVANFLYLLQYILQIRPFSYQVLLLIAFVITGALFGWGILRHRLFNLTRTAPRKIVDTMPDAVIMVDNQNKIGYLNPTAQAIIHIPIKVAIGNPARAVLIHWPYLEQRFHQGNQSRTEVKIIPSITGRVYDCRISKLEGHGNYHEGHLIILRDITERKELEKDLKAREM